MKLTEIYIHSYRSIVNQKIQFSNNCIGLIGMNESGKSNVLQAIRTLDKDFQISIKDKSKIDNELPRITFTFEFDNDKDNSIYKEFIESQVDLVDTKGNSILKHIKLIKYNIFKYLGKDGDSFKKFKNHNCLYEIDFTNGIMRLKDKSLVLDSYKIFKNDEEVNLNSFEYIDSSLLPKELVKDYEPVDESYIRNKINVSLLKFLESRIPRVVYWEYSSKYLLPSEISYDDFMKNDEPYENSSPLFNIMLLSNRLGLFDSSDIANKITEWRADSSVRMRDSKIIKEDLNAYVRSVWNDFDQELNIGLEQDKITIHINDPKSPINNFYDMESRSQGFKTFISFILNIAAEADSDILYDFVLILDEPETHLHPSSVRYMKNDLLKLSQENYVVFATHSIFMIDRENLRRHVLVKKIDETTRITPVDRNNILQESVIYGALGTTIDEFSINNFNLMFEGESDLLIFDYFVKNCLHKKINVFSEYRLYDGGGTSDMYNFFKAKILPPDSKWILILDSDLPGKKLQENITTKLPTLQKNIEYHYYSSTDNVELEDLLPIEFINSIVNDVSELLELEINTQFSTGSGFISKHIEEFKNRNRISKENSILFEVNFKNLLIEKLKSTFAVISKQGSYEKRLESFSMSFPKYFEFINAILEHYKE